MTGDVNLAEHLDRLTESIDLGEHRVALILKSGSTYFIDGIVSEWSNAVYFRPEGQKMQPVLVFKSCIEAVKIMDRPTPRKKSE